MRMETVRHRASQPFMNPEGSNGMQDGKKVSDHGWMEILAIVVYSTHQDDWELEEWIS